MDCLPVSILFLYTIDSNLLHPSLIPPDKPAADLDSLTPPKFTCDTCTCIYNVDKQVPSLCSCNMVELHVSGHLSIIGNTLIYHQLFPS